MSPKETSLWIGIFVCVHVLVNIYIYMYMDELLFILTFDLV